MTTAANEDVRARLARRGSREVSEDALRKIRNKIAEIRELDAQISDLTEKLAEKQAARVKITDVDLPDLMKENKVTSITLAAAGNLPAYDATLETTYHAALPVKDQEKVAVGIKFLVEVWEVPDIVKNAVTLKFGAGELKRAKKLFSLLKKNKYEYDNRVSVNASTLTAELRRRVRAGDVPSPADLAKIGGYVREVVNTEPVKKD